MLIMMTVILFLAIIMLVFQLIWTNMLCSYNYDLDTWVTEEILFAKRKKRKDERLWRKSKLTVRPQKISKFMFIG